MSDFYTWFKQPEVQCATGVASTVMGLFGTPLQTAQACARSAENLKDRVQEIPQAVQDTVRNLFLSAFFPSVPLLNHGICSAPNAWQSVLIFNPMHRYGLSFCGQEKIVEFKRLNRTVTAGILLGLGGVATMGAAKALVQKAQASQESKVSETTWVEMAQDMMSWGILGLF